MARRGVERNRLGRSVTPRGFRHGLRRADPGIWTALPRSCGL